MMTSRFIVVSIGSLAFGQTNFGGSSGSSSGSTSSAQEFPIGSLDTDTRYLLKPFLKEIYTLLFLRFFTGNDALNGGLVGAGLGALGATILGPAGVRHTSQHFIRIILKSRRCSEQRQHQHWQLLWQTSQTPGKMIPSKIKTIVFVFSICLLAISNKSRIFVPY